MIWHFNWRNSYGGVLAHLAIARANALQAKNSKGADFDAARIRALAAYKAFLADTEKSSKSWYPP